MLAGVALKQTPREPKSVAVRQYHKASQKYALGEWRVEIRRDSFTSRVTCRLHTRNYRMVYVPGAVGFRVGHKLDTTAAWYRVDGGEAVRWQDRYPQLIETGVPLSGPSLANPTGGVVWVPVGEVSKADIIDVQPDDRHRAKRFHMGAFALMLTAAKDNGCVPEQVFAS